MRIAIDAMGGDRAPNDVIAGVRLFLSDKPNAEILLVGQREKLEEPCADLPVQLVDAPSVVGMNESPSNAVKNLRDSQSPWLPPS